MYSKDDSSDSKKKLGIQILLKQNYSKPCFKACYLWPLNEEPPHPPPYSWSTGYVPPLNQSSKIKFKNF